MDSWTISDYLEWWELPEDITLVLKLIPESGEVIVNQFKRNAWLQLLQKSRKLFLSDSSLPLNLCTYSLHQKKVTFSSSIFPGEPKLASVTLGHFITRANGEIKCNFLSVKSVVASTNPGTLVRSTRPHWSRPVRDVTWLSGQSVHLDACKWMHALEQVTDLHLVKWPFLDYKT